MDLKHSKSMNPGDIAKKPRRVPGRPKTQAERREDAKARILDAAEQLFAQHGRNGVTVRAVGKEASVDAALVHYYFGDMEALFHEVVQRKSVFINPLRNQAMDEYLAAHGNALTVEGALDAFLRPVFETIWNDPKHWTNYVAIIAHANSSPFQGRDVMHEAFDPTVSRFIDLLKRLAPAVPPQEIYWQYHLLSGSLMIALAQTGRIDILSGGLCKSSDMRTAYDSIKRMFCGGFEALRSSYASPPAKPRRSK